MDSQRFYQAGMKKCQAGIEGMQAELMQEEIRILAMA